MILLIMLIISISVTPKLYATSYQVILGGESIGLQLDSDVKITGKYYVETVNGKKAPWENSNINVGDSIIAINNEKVSSSTEIQKIITGMNDGEKINLTLSRNGQNITTTIKLHQTQNNKISLGLYIKDKILGIGTLTFIDENNMQFAALGHAVVDALNYSSDNLGTLTYSTVSGIKKADNNCVGEKRASLLSKEIGVIRYNTDIGVFGTFSSSCNNKKIMIAEINEVHTGKAQIVTVIEGTKKEYFDVEIISVDNQQEKNVKGIKIKVTDPLLLQKTGGIIQGMSGSPIVQDGKLVGAVSHVTVDNPKVGYGVYAKWMYEAMS